MYSKEEILDSKVIRSLAILVLVVLALGILLPQASQVNALDPVLELPYGSGMNGQVRFEGGPHSFGNTNGLAIVQSADASGIDFAGGPDQPCGIPYNSTLSGGNCGFVALAMAEGDVIYAGKGSFGNQVAIKLTTGQVLIYGHLFDYWPYFEDSLDQGQPYHVEVGDMIGHVGGTGISGGNIDPDAWHVHLHLELREGATCTRLCVGFVGETPLQPIGNPISWENQSVNGYTIYGYHTSSGSSTIQNYDGVAIDLFSGGIAENLTTVSNFAYWDRNDYPTYQTTFLTNRWVRIPEAFASQCNSTVDCENIDMTTAVRFAGHGAIGGGQVMFSDLSSPPSPTPTPGPSPTPPSQVGDSKVDVYENTNYQPTQYGWDNPTGGWVNVPNYMDDRISSIALDSGWSILVAKDANGGGTTKCLVTSYSDLSGAYYNDSSPMTDTISSVNVFHNSNCGGAYLGTEPGDTVTVWVDPNYWNTHYGWHDPFNGNVAGYVSNGITSIGVAPGWSAVLYESGSLGGGFACFTASDPDLTNNTLNTGTPVNDTIESIEVFHDSICGGRIHPPTVNFTATVTNIATKEVANHLVWSGAAPVWQHFDFGDGATFDVQGGSGDVSPTHQYANYGTYDVTVTVYGTDGVGYPYTQQVVVQPPAPTFSLTINSAHTGSGLVDFTLNWSNALADWHHIDFGDGQSFDVNGASGSQNATHIYNPGTYTLSFTVKGLDGQNYPTSQQIVMPVPTMSLTLNSVDAVSGLVNYTATWANAPVDSWQRVDFGHDGAYVDYQGTADTKVDSHIFPVGTFTMTFTVNSRTGQTYQTTQQIVVTGPHTPTPVPPTPTPVPPTLSLTLTVTDPQNNLVEADADWSNCAEDWQILDWGDSSNVGYFGGSGTSIGHQNGYTHNYAAGTWTATFTCKGLDGNNYPVTAQVTVGS